MHHSLQIPNQMLIHFLRNGLEIKTSWIFFFRSYQCTRVRFPPYGNLSSNCLWRNTFLKFTKFALIILKNWLACLACIYGVMDALEKFGEHERSVRVALFLMNHFSTILKPFCINTGHATLKFLLAMQDALKMLGDFWLGDLNLLCREFCSARNSQNLMEW